MRFAHIAGRWMPAFAMLAAMTAPAPAAAQVVASNLFSPADVFKLKSIGEVRISPDGRTIAYEALDADIMIDGRRRSIRVVDVATGQDRLLADGARAPRWSPDGRSIAYADRMGGVDRLLSTRLDGRPPSVVASLQGSPSAVTWSPDGRTLAFSSFVPTRVTPRLLTPPPPVGAKWAPPPRVITTVRYQEDGSGAVTPGHNQLFVVAVAGGTPRQVTAGDLDVSSDAAWLPDGRALIYGAVGLDAFGPGFRTGRLYRVPAGGGRSVPVTSTDLSAQTPVVSPDGRRIAFIAFAADSRTYSPIQLRVMDVAGGASRVLDAPLDRDFSAVAWSRDGRALYAGYADRSVGKLRRIAADGTGSRDVARDLGGDFSVSDSGAIAYAAASSDRPSDVAIARDGAAPTLLTHRNQALLGGKALGTTEPLAVTSSLDGAPVGAWLTRPAGYVAGRRYPLILDIHGGPYGHDGPVWRTRDQLYAARGHAVLHVNYRGSTSYGFAFADRIAADPLAPSYADLMSAVDAAVATGIADPDRLFVTGGSAGGELTAWIVGNTARFKAAMAEKPIINRISHLLTSDQYYVSKLIAMSAPWRDAPRLWSLSPLSRVGEVRTPTMLVVGEEDRRTPPGEALQFYNALTLRGVPTALVLVRQASHASLGAPPSQLVSIVELTLDWFEKQALDDERAALNAVSSRR